MVTGRVKLSFTTELSVTASDGWRRYIFLCFFGRWRRRVVVEVVRPAPALDDVCLLGGRLTVIGHG